MYVLLKIDKNNFDAQGEITSHHYTIWHYNVKYHA